MLSMLSINQIFNGLLNKIGMLNENAYKVTAKPIKCGSNFKNLEDEFLFISRFNKR